MTRPFLSRTTSALIALAAAAVFFVAVNVIADHTLRGARFDLTQEHLFTLSKGTLNTLAKIDEPITLRFYYSPHLGDSVPAYGVYAQRVRETLEEYAALAKGKIDLQILDPEPFSTTEDRAVAFGLQGVPLDSGGEQVYFGLAATNSTDDQQVISFFQPDRESFLEYDLTKLVHALASPKKTVIGLISSLPLEGDIMAAMQGRPMQAYAIIDQLRQLDEVRTIAGGADKIPDDVDVLMIVHPKNLSDKTLYAVDQFVLKGGRALVFVDPDAEAQQAHPSQFNPPGSPADSNLDKLFAAWGVAMEPKMVAGDRETARKVNAGTASRVEPVDYVAWLSLKPRNFNRDNLITADLGTINVATAGILKPRDGAKTAFSPLISTSSDSEEIPVEKVQGPLPDIAALLADFKPLGKPLVIAADVTGPADTAFPDGPPVDKDKADKDKKAGKDPKDTQVAQAAAAAAQLKTAVKPIDIVVVADTDILDDRLWVQTQEFMGQRVGIPSANNGDFVANAVEILAGGDDLVSLRSRGSSARPFERVEALQRVADAQYQATEKDLQQKLKDTQAKINNLRDQEGKADSQPGSEQAQAIDTFRGEMLKIRQQLREVQLALRRDINGLKAWLEFFDIAFVPILVALLAAIVSLMRRRRRKRRARVA